MNNVIHKFLEDSLNAIKKAIINNDFQTIYDLISFTPSLILRAEKRGIYFIGEITQMLFNLEAIDEYHVKTFQLLMENASIIPLTGKHCIPIAHALIIEYDFRPKPEIIELFGILMTSPYYSIDDWIEFKSITVEHLNSRHTVTIYGTALSLALHFKQTGIFAEILLRMGADVTYINWERVCFTTDKTKTLKSIALSGNIISPQQWLHLETVKLNAINEDTENLIDFLAAIRSKPLSIRNTMLHKIRKKLNRNERLQWALNDKIPESWAKENILFCEWLTFDILCEE